tara:strand:+ start:751 stop:999 length:249 start_codon:yes stop_codon:yes gene_type:complete
MQTFKEWLSPIKRGKKLQKKDIPHIDDHLSHSYMDKKIYDKISFDNDAIYLKKTGKNIITSKDYLNKMTIDDVIQTLMKKVR